MNEKVTAQDIRNALRKTYCEPDWYLGFEVGNGTGARLRRHADAVAICNYPSRDYEIRGFEIKVSRNDLKSELDNCAKADAVAKYCNCWFLVVPKGLTKDMMIPEPWGIIEYADGKLRQKKPAAWNKEPEFDKGFAVALYRGIDRVKAVNLDEWRQEQLRELNERLPWQIQCYKKDLEAYRTRVEEISKKVGFSIMSYDFPKVEIEAFNIARNLLYGNVDNNMWWLEKSLAHINKLCEDMKAALLQIQKLKDVPDINVGNKKERDDDGR